jgi:hypothetical protein
MGRLIRPGWFFLRYFQCAAWIPLAGFVFAHSKPALDGFHQFDWHWWDLPVAFFLYAFAMMAMESLRRPAE